MLSASMIPEVREESVYQVNRDRSYVHYDNAIWLREERPKGLSSRRTSLIVDPAGRKNPFTDVGRTEATGSNRRGKKLR